jgi:ABC-type transporter Mla subunit MlaD
MAITAEELQVQLNTQVKETLSCVVTGIKKYVDGKDEVLKTELKDVIVKELSGVDGLGAQLEKIKEMADAFAKVFDSDGDGTITPEEILAKLTAVQASIDKVASDVTNLQGDVADLSEALENAIKDLQSKIDALELAVAKNRDEVAAVKADLKTNYFTKEEVKLAISIDAKAICEDVTKILFPENSEEPEGGDGAVE